MGGAMDLVASAGTKVVVTMEHSAKVCIHVRVYLCVHVSLYHACSNQQSLCKLPHKTNFLSQGSRLHEMANFPFPCWYPHQHTLYLLPIIMSVSVLTD